MTEQQTWHRDHGTLGLQADDDGLQSKGYFTLKHCPLHHFSYCKCCAPHSPRLYLSPRYLSFTIFFTPSKIQKFSPQLPYRLYCPKFLQLRENIDITSHTHHAAITAQKPLLTWQVAGQDDSTHETLPHTAQARREWLAGMKLVAAAWPAAGRAEQEEKSVHHLLTIVFSPVLFSLSHARTHTHTQCLTQGTPCCRVVYQCVCDTKCVCVCDERERERICLRVCVCVPVCACWGEGGGGFFFLKHAHVCVTSELTTTTTTKIIRKRKGKKKHPASEFWNKTERQARDWRERQREDRVLISKTAGWRTQRKDELHSLHSRHFPADWTGQAAAEWAPQRPTSVERHNAAPHTKRRSPACSNIRAATQPSQNKILVREGKRPPSGWSRQVSRKLRQRLGLHAPAVCTPLTHHHHHHSLSSRWMNWSMSAVGVAASEVPSALSTANQPQAVQVRVVTRWRRCPDSACPDWCGWVGSRGRGKQD